MHHTPDHEQFHVLTNSHFTINAIQLLRASLNKQAHTKYKSNGIPKSAIPFRISDQVSIQLTFLILRLKQVCEIQPHSQVLLEKPTGPQPAKKFRAFYEARRFITTNHKRLPLEPIASQINPVHVFPSYFVTIHLTFWHGNFTFKF
jgi:hypothetical protein